MKKPLNIAVLAALLMAVFTLLIPPISGAPDDGSNFNILNENGLYNLEGGGGFAAVYGVKNEAGEQPSALLPIRFLRGAGGEFDIRLLSAFYLGLYILGLYLGLRVLFGRFGPAGVLGGFLAALIFVDGGYISYFNSLYPRAASLCAFVLVCGSLFYILGGRKGVGGALLIFVFSSVWLVFTGKNQMPVGILAAFVAARLCFRLKGKRPRMSAEAGEGAGAGAGLKADAEASAGTGTNAGEGGAEASVGTGTNADLGGAEASAQLGGAEASAQLGGAEASAGTGANAGEDGAEASAQLDGAGAGAELGAGGGSADNRGNKWLRAGAGAGAILVFLGTIFAFNYLSAPKRDINLYHSVFYGILPGSAAPERDLAELGLAPGLVKFSGKSYYEIGGDIGEGFYDNISYGKIARFYIKHPARLYKSLSRAAKNSFFINAPLLNDKTSPKRGLLIWSNIKRTLPHFFLAIAAFIAAAAFFALKRGGKFKEGILFVIAAAVYYYAAPVIISGQAGIDGEMFMFNAAFDILIVIAVIFCLEEISKRREKIKNLYGVR